MFSLGILALFVSPSRAPAAGAEAMSFEQVVLEISPALKKDLKQEGWSLNKSDAGKGYIKVEGPFEGRNNYFLFRGKPSDIVIHDAQGEDLELHQNFGFFLVTGGQIKEVRRKEVFPERDIKRAYRDGRRALKKAEKDHPWENHVESFELPIYDREIKLVISSDDPNFYTTTKDVKAAVATLRWAGEKFSLREIQAPVIQKMAE